MIFGNINNLSEFPFLEEQVKECFEYAKTHDLASYEKGSYEIDGDRLFVNIVEYTTTTPEERFWEAHKNCASQKRSSGVVVVYSTILTNSLSPSIS